MSDAPRPLRQPGLIVYAFGIATSIFTIWLVNLMQDHGENPMGWYARGIIPVGAFLVGLVSGLGYAVASYFLNVKLSKSFLMFMLLTACLDYSSMHFVTYSNLIEKLHIDPSRYTFISWFREVTEGMTFTSSSSSSSEIGSPLGMWGYVFRVLELIGFSLGVLTSCFVVFGKAYCRPCQKYLKPHLKRTVSSPTLISDWKKVPRKERPQFLQNALSELLAQVQPTLGSIRTAPLSEVQSVLDSTGGLKAVKKTVGAVTITVTKCPLCDSHHITAALTNVTNNGKFKTSTVEVMDKSRTVTVGEPA